MARKSPADRVKAHRIRSVIREIASGNMEADALNDDDIAFIEMYTGETIDNLIAQGGGDVEAFASGRSASASRTVHIEERAAEAEGAHPHPDSLRAMGRA